MALEAAPRFGLKTPEAKAILREVLGAVAGWRKTGRRLRLKASILEAYASAFEKSAHGRSPESLVKDSKAVHPGFEG